LEGSKVERDQLQQKEVMVFEFARQILRLAVMQVELESSFVAVVHALAFQPSNLSTWFHPLLRNLGSKIARQIWDSRQGLTRPALPGISDTPASR
jgi:hypothetical protein